MTGNVGIVIVSHSPKVAEGAADMVRQMVGDEVPCAWTGGNPAAGSAPMPSRSCDAIEQVWSPSRRGGPGRSRRGRDEQRDGDRDAAAEDRAAGSSICNAPIVEGAVIAATEASGGAHASTRSCATAEELSPVTSALSIEMPTRTEARC